MSRRAEVIVERAHVGGVRGWFGRRLGFGEYREEGTSRLEGASGQGTAKSAPSTFIPELVRKGDLSRTDLDHQDMMCRQHPIANYVTYKIGRNAIDDWFTFRDPKTGEEIMEDVLERLGELLLRENMINAVIYERVHGWSWLYLGQKKFRTEEEDDTIALVDWFTPRNAEVVSYDKLGSPETIRITVQTGKASSTVDKHYDLPASDFILVRTRPYDRSEKGITAYDSIWDVLNYEYLTLHSMAFYDIKIGQGMLVMTYKGKIDANVKARAQTMFENMSVKRSMVIEEAKVSGLDWKGASASRTDFEGHHNILLELSSGGSGVPKDCMTGASAGAITGSEVNHKALYAVLNEVQRSVEYVIREVVERLGKGSQPYVIKWKLVFAHDEMEQAQIQLLKAQALQLSQPWTTLNELRKEQGKPSKPGGDEIVDPNAITVGMVSEEQEERTRNPTGESS